MTIIRKISVFIKKKSNFLPHLDAKISRIQKINPFTFISFIIFISVLFYISTNLINKKNISNTNNLKEISKNNEFYNLANFLISKLNSPYKEINYIIQKNDTVEKILKKFKVKNDDIREITIKLKEKKLANIYSGRKLSLILKKQENEFSTLVNLVYPISNTTSIIVRKSKNNYDATKYCFPTVEDGLEGIRFIERSIASSSSDSSWVNF